MVVTSLQVMVIILGFDSEHQGSQAPQGDHLAREYSQSRAAAAASQLVGVLRMRVTLTRMSSRSSSRINFSRTF